MKIQFKQEKGFTFLEVLIVITLSVVMASSGLLVFNRLKRQEEIFSVVVQIVRLLETARAKSVACQNNANWKVVVATDKVTLKDNQGNITETYRLPPAYKVTGPIDEVVFAKIDGLVERCVNNCLFKAEEVSGKLSYEFNILFSGAVEY